MKLKNLSIKPAVLAAFAAVPCMLFSSVVVAITCPANSSVDSLVWENVWTLANDNNYGVQTFQSESGDVDFQVQVSMTAGAGCNDSHITELWVDPYYNGLLTPDNETLMLRLDMPNRNCEARFRVSAFNAGTATPFDLNRLEYTLYDVDVGGSSPTYTWIDVIRYDPAPINRFNGAGSNFTQTPTTTRANIDNCTQSSLANLEECRQTPSWDGPLNQFDFFYQSDLSSDVLVDPDTQRIFISNIEFCSPNRPDLSIVKTDAPDPVRRGQNLVYTLAVTNSPSADGYATSALIQDTLPAGLTWISTTNSNGGGTCTVGDLAACNCSQPGNTGAVTCEMGDIAIGATKTVVVTTKVD